MSKLNIVIGADITALKKGFDDAVSIVANGSKGMNEQVGKAAKDIQSRLEALASKRPTQRVVRELQTLAMEARQLGPEFKTMADQFIRAAGEMKDSIGDAAAEVGYFASDTRRLDALIGGAQAVAAGFGLIEGAMAAAGIEDEDLQKRMVKLQGIMLALNSLQQLHAQLLQDSALKTGILTAAKSALAGATTLAATSMGRFKLALAATGIGAVLVGVGMLVSKLSELKTSTQLAAEATERNAKALKDQNDALKLSNEYMDIELSIQEERMRAAGATEEEIRKQRVKTLQEQKKNIEASIAAYAKDAENQIYAANQSGKSAEEISKMRREINIKYDEDTRQLYLDLANYEAKIQIEGYKAQQDKNKKISDSNKKAAEDYKKALELQKKLQEEGFQKQINLVAHLQNSELISAQAKYKSEEALALAKLEINNKYLKKLDAINKQQGKLDYNLKEQLQQNEIDLANKRKELGVQTVADLNTSLGKMKPVQIKFEANMNMDSFAGRMSKMQEQMSAEFERTIEDITVAFGDALGKMIAGENGAFRDFGKTALMAVADFMNSFGKALITTAIAADAFKKLILAHPVAAIAAGVAVVAGSAVIKAQLEKGPNFTAFADGGIVYGPTLGLMGEYPGARSNPEVIAPLNKLKDMITPVNEGGYIASTRISGRDLALVIEKNQTAYNRG